MGGQQFPVPGSQLTGGQSPQYLSHGTRPGVGGLAQVQLWVDVPHVHVKVSLQAVQAHNAWSGRTSDTYYTFRVDVPHVHVKVSLQAVQAHNAWSGRTSDTYYTFSVDVPHVHVKVSLQAVQAHNAWSGRTRDTYYMFRGGDRSAGRASD